MTPSISCIREQFSCENAEQIVASASRSATRVERTLYYPYHWYRLHYSLVTWIGRPRFEVECLVDARKGLVSTADAFETHELRPPLDDVLETCVEFDAGWSAARRTLSHELGRKHRAATPLPLELVAGGLLYKKFWIVRCGSDGTKVLLDSSSGQFITLSGAAA